MLFFLQCKDTHVSAVVSDCGNVMHISVGMSSRSTTNSEKEWHVSTDINYLKSGHKNVHIKMDNTFNILSWHSFQ